MNSEIGPVGERAQAEMKKLGFDSWWFDSMGNTVGKIGSGPRILIYDSHIDTVGIGDPDEDEESERILGLMGGADDYLPKPFSPLELAVRIRTTLKRSRSEPAAETPVVVRVSGPQAADSGLRRVHDLQSRFP